jgi:hypothetical protein
MLVLSPNAVRFFSPLGAILPNEPVAAFVTVVRIILPFVAPLDSPPKCKRSPLREEGIPDLLVSRDRDVVGCPHRDWRWTQEEEQWKEGKSASCNFGIHLQSVVIHSPSGLVEPFFRIGRWTVPQQSMPNRWKVGIPTTKQQKKRAKAS